MRSGSSSFTGPRNLANISSPFSSTTAGRSDVFTGCGSSKGKTYKFYAVLQHGQTLSIGQTSNDFDSKHSTFWSTSANPSSYPLIEYTSGSHCTDDPDTQTVTMTNSQLSPRKVWYVVNGCDSATDGHDDADGYYGKFTLAWTIRLVCPADATSIAGSTRFTDCKANADHYNDGSAVRACPPNTTSPAGSTQYTQCVCKPGLYYAEIGEGTQRCEAFVRCEIKTQWKLNLDHTQAELRGNPTQRGRGSCGTCPPHSAMPGVTNVPVTCRDTDRPRTPAPTNCTDTPGFQDAYGTCATYAENKWCESGAMGTGWGASRGALGAKAVGACCVCGKPTQIAVGICKDDDDYIKAQYGASCAQANAVQGVCANPDYKAELEKYCPVTCEIGCAGVNCSDYAAKKWCAGGKEGPAWNKTWGALATLHPEAVEHCCACGGGATNTTFKLDSSAIHTICKDDQWKATSGVTCAQLRSLKACTAAVAGNVSTRRVPTQTTGLAQSYVVSGSSNQRSLNGVYMPCKSCNMHGLAYFTKGTGISKRFLYWTPKYTGKWLLGDDATAEWPSKRAPHIFDRVVIRSLFVSCFVRNGNRRLAFRFATEAWYSYSTQSQSPKP